MSAAVEAEPRLAPGDLSKPRWFWAVQAGLLLALWVITRPYHGIVHDGRLYTFQALKHLDPDGLGPDLYFRYGSQDSFSAFSLLFHPLVGALGPGLAHAVATGIGHVLWLAALAVFLRTLVGGGRAFVLAAVGVILLNAYYGGLFVFRYGEPFATPRLFAEALLLAAMTLALRGRLPVAGLCVIGAAALHPLVGFSGAAVVGLMAALKDRRFWWLIAAGVAAGLALAALGVEPFARLHLVMDPAWLAVVQERAPLAFTLRWNPLDYVRLAATAVILFLAHRRLEDPAVKRLVLAAALAGALGVLATFVTGDLAHSVLMINLQPWRTLWIPALLANALTATVLLSQPMSRICREMFAAALVCAAIPALMGTPDLFSPIIFLVGWAIVALEAHDGQPAGQLLRWAARLIALSTLAAAIYLSFLARASHAAPLALELVAAAVGVVVLALLLSPPARWRARVLLAGAVALLTASIATIDRRDDWMRFVEADETPLGLQAFVAGAGELYWERGAELQWLKLRQPSYYSCMQGTGVMFYAATAAEYRRRGEGLSGLGTRDFTRSAGSFCAKTDVPRRADVTRRQLVAACRALPELDTLILPRLAPGTPHTSWSPPAPQRVTDGTTKLRPLHRFYRYSCSDLR